MSRIRVYELAKELGIPSRDLLTRLNDLGHFVRSNSSVLAPHIVEQVRTRYNAKPSGLPNDVDPIEQAIRRNLLDGEPLRQRRARDTGPTARRQSPPPPCPWLSRLFEPSEREAWERVGVHSAPEAEQFRDAGITPRERAAWGTMPLRAIEIAKAAHLTPSDMAYRRSRNEPTVGSMLATGSTLAEIQAYTRPNHTE